MQGKVLAMALAAATAAAAPAPREELGPLLRRCLAAHGGKEAVARARVTRQEGRVTSLLHPGQEGRIVRAYERPGRLRVEVAFPGSPPEVRVLDGGRGWRDGEEVSGPRLAAMMLQAVRLDLPALLLDWKERVEDLGTAEVDGRKVRVVSFRPAPGLVVEAAIDVASGRIVRSRGTSRDPGMHLEFVTTYEDFRAVEGVSVAFRELNWANGRYTGETRIEKVEFPGALPQGTFRP
jgi:hypothetical protein